jgi:putative Mg2+ transporter-C (MgtC) family protein
MLDWGEIALRLGAATLAGAAIGLNRDLRGKPIGVRTLGLVGLATSLAVALTQSATSTEISDAGSRVIQGILTGIGFLGAGVIVHRDANRRVHGLTSAACTWLTACIGIVCGAGEWRAAILAVVIAFIVLIAGGPAERWAHRLLTGERDDSGQSGGQGPSVGRET